MHSYGTGQPVMGAILATSSPSTSLCTVIEEFPSARHCFKVLFTQISFQINKLPYEIGIIITLT
jgi:hypothetical protein